jgi:hypothetical protein
MIVDPQLVGLVRDFVGIFGWASILAGGSWSIKEYLAFKRRNKETLEAAVASNTKIAEVKLAVDAMQNNHLVHLQGDVTELKTTIGTHFEDFVKINEKQFEVLTSIDKNIAVLKDRGERPTRMSVTVDHPDPNI